MGYEPGRSTAGLTATLRQVLSKAAEWGVGGFVASADVEGAFDGIKHDDVAKALLQKGVHPESVCSLLRESSDLKGRIYLPGAPMLVVLVRVEGPDMWNQVLDNAYVNLQVAGNRRELASCSPRTTVKPKSAVAHLVKM